MRWSLLSTFLHHSLKSSFVFSPAFFSVLHALLTQLQHFLATLPRFIGRKADAKLQFANALPAMASAATMRIFVHVLDSAGHALPLQTVVDLKPDAVVVDLQRALLTLYPSISKDRGDLNLLPVYAPGAPREDWQDASKALRPISAVAAHQAGPTVTEFEQRCFTVVSWPATMPSTGQFISHPSACTTSPQLQHSSTVTHSPAVFLCCRQLSPLYIVLPEEAESYYSSGE